MSYLLCKNPCDRDGQVPYAWIALPINPAAAAALKAFQPFAQKLDAEHPSFYAIFARCELLTFGLLVVSNAAELDEAFADAEWLLTAGDGIAFIAAPDLGVECRVKADDILWSSADTGDEIETPNLSWADFDALLADPTADVFDTLVVTGCVEEAVE